MSMEKGVVSFGYFEFRNFEHREKSMQISVGKYYVQLFHEPMHGGKSGAWWTYGDYGETIDGSFTLNGINVIDYDGCYELAQEVRCAIYYLMNHKLKLFMPLGIKN